MCVCTHTYVYLYMYTLSTDPPLYWPPYSSDYTPQAIVTTSGTADPPVRVEIKNHKQRE